MSRPQLLERPTTGIERLIVQLEAGFLVDAISGCWTWQRSKTPEGYPRLTFQGKGRYAHRMMWVLVVGDIPAEVELDHLCRNRACVNPGHLEMVTHLENHLRASRARQTHCKYGHRFDAKNTVMRQRKGRRPHRECRACWTRKRRDKGMKPRVFKEKEIAKCRALNS